MHLLRVGITNIGGDRDGPRSTSSDRVRRRTGAALGQEPDDIPHFEYDTKAAADFYEQMPSVLRCAVPGGSLSRNVPLTVTPRGLAA